MSTCKGIRDHIQGGRESGVRAAPTFYVNREIRDVSFGLGSLFDAVESAFVITGRDASLPLQTSVHGVFAIGDVRAGSVKRVGGAIGEGAAVVSQSHARLA